MKKINSLIFSILLIVFTLITASSMAEIGGTDDNITWSLSADGVLTISGTGRMKNYAVEETPSYLLPRDNRPWTSYLYDITACVIEKGVTSIGDNAFKSCENMKSVIIPDGIAHIGNNAFDYCNSITRIDLPDSIDNDFIEFRYCTALESVSIPSSVKSFSVACCDALKSISIPKGVTDIYFGECTALENITIPDSVTYLCFVNCPALESITIPESVTSIGAVSGCSSQQKLDTKFERLVS